MTFDKEKPSSEECEFADSPEEYAQLRRVCDDISVDVFLVAVAELAERFTYRSITAPMQNYIQNPREDPFRPGALGMGQTAATGINYFFVCWCYMAPILGAVVADTFLGRFKTIVLATGFAASGVMTLFVTSLPGSLDRGAGMPGLMIALILVGLGVGGIKSNVAPLIAEQYGARPERVKTLPSGERVVVDPSITVQTIYARYFWVINLGGLSVIPVSWLELKVDFWAAFMLPLCFWVLAMVALIAGRTRYVVRPPQGSAITTAIRVLWISIRNGGKLDAARPYVLEKNGTPVPWDDVFVDELKRALVACRVFPIFWLCNGQATSNLVSQAMSMNTHGVPNDMMGFCNPATILIAVPLFETVIFPTLRRFNIRFKPISRMTTGFFIKACAIAYAAILQELIYKASPCQRSPEIEGCGETRRGEKISIFLQVPVYSMIGLSEFFAVLSGMEYAYTKAPQSMRSIVSALFLLMSAIGAALGITLSPVSVDPTVLIEFISLSAVMFVTAIAFFLCFRRYNRAEEEMNQLKEPRSSSETDESSRLERQ
ncbi:POT peptide transporter [Aspergillus campestris IBT 28561]|uniref:POT peptide transporter n=1 Tax=Aspergillus campestris (strain IBT 28561) TaxID=1392248 RepID=A0A2I1D451_ASPC2|nr:POT peptide transporter [Aspergillus campestris IBT 28561]PKY04657.1 POT peptide transporter [Aspergillus campestris IBT 28561]